jgi:hypothetical protein
VRDTGLTRIKRREVELVVRGREIDDAQLTDGSLVASTTGVVGGKALVYTFVDEVRLKIGSTRRSLETEICVSENVASKDMIVAGLQRRSPERG